MITEIILKDVRFHARHGVMEQENTIGGEFTINLRIRGDFAKAMLSDDIVDTIDYGRVFEVVKQEMDIPSRLLEHVAGRIIKALRNEFQNIMTIDLELIKENPPLQGQLKAGIHITD